MSARPRTLRRRELAAIERWHKRRHDRGPARRRWYWPAAYRCEWDRGFSDVARARFGSPAVHRLRP